jgi:solute:Na+ symporter, SSS family
VSGVYSSPASLSVIDWIEVCSYAGALIALIVVLTRGRLRSVDYFLASRATRWPVVGLALIASNISATALVGLSGGAYSVGISVFDYEWTATPVLVFFAIVVVPPLLASRAFTVPEFLERRFDGRVRVYFTCLTLLLNVFVDSAGVLYSGSLLCQLIFPSWHLWSIVLGIGACAGLYATLGGLRAVIYTEAVQALMMFTGAIFIAVAAFSRAGGWHAVMHRVDPAALSLIRPIGDAGVPWPGLLFGIPVLGFYYWCTNQSMVQRVLAARDIPHARWGALLAGLLKLPILYLMVLPGICALILYPQLRVADQVYPRLMLGLLPSGLLGIAVAGMMAAAVVSLAALFNSAATQLTMDVIKKLRPGLSDAQLVSTGRLCTAGLLITSIAWTPNLQHFPSLWQYLQAVLAYVVPPIVAVFALGLFWRGATAQAAATTIRLGSLFGLTLFAVNVPLHLTHMHFLYAAPILLVIDLFIMLVASLKTASAALAASTGSAWSHEREQPIRLPLWQDYRFQSAALLALTAVIVILFR